MSAEGYDLDAFRVPDLFEHIVGWRAWRVHDTGLHVRLVSEYSPMHGLSDWEAIWPPDRWHFAVCKHHEDDPTHEPPMEGCSCGLYAANTPERLKELGYGRYSDTRVLGAVALAGKVIPGTQGYKAERARPLRLWVPMDTKPKIVRALASTYEIEVELGHAEMFNLNRNLR